MCLRRQLALHIGPIEVYDHYETTEEWSDEAMDDAKLTGLNLRRGYTIALVCAAVLSTTAIFIRYLTQTFELPELVLAFWRDSFTALTLVPVLWKLRLLRVPRGQMRYLVCYGFVLSVFNALWTLSVSLNGAAVSTVLVYCSTAFTALLGWWLLKEHLDWVKLLMIAITLGGCFLVSGAIDPTVWQSNLGGIVTGLLSGLAYAGYSLLGRAASERGINPWTTLFYTFAFAAGFLLLFNVLPAGILPGAASKPGDFLWLGNSLPGWGALILLAAGPTVLGFGLYNVSLVYLPSSLANMVVTLEPVFTATIAYLLLGELMNSVQMLGSAIILAGVFLLRVYEGKRATSQAINEAPSRLAVSTAQSD